MRRAAFLLISGLALTFSLSACTNFGGNQTVPSDDPLGNPDACGASGFQSFVGQRVNTSNIENHPRVRVIRPGTIVTQDYRTDRVNWSLDADDRVLRVYCG